MQTIFKNLKINNQLTDITCIDGKITKVGKTPDDGIDFCGKKVYPGLIDIHTHGRCGVDADTAQLAELSLYYAQAGTTSYLPTTTTLSLESLKRTMDTPIPQKGANILGFHLEGPYINEKYKGAQNPDYIRKPDINDFKGYDDKIKMITLAPEIEGAEEYIKQSKAIVVLGHTDADYETTVKAARAGAKCLTHTFNAMPPIHHREPAVIGAAFDEGMYAQIITDGKHVHPSAVRMLYKLFGSDRMIIISDSLCAAGLPDGEYVSGGLKVKIIDGTARIEEGNLAGCTLSLLECVKCAISFGIPEEEAFKMASQTPAELLGVNKGIIKEGYDCDLIILDDENNLEEVIINGEIFRKDN